MLDIDDSMDVDLDVTVYTVQKPVVASKSAYDPQKNAHLKGRRRFTADLDDIKAECKDGLMFHGLRVKIRPGDDEGSVEAFIENQAAKHILAVNLLISDTSEYPSSHSCFGYSPDPDISARLQDVVENIASQSSRPLRETLEKLLSSVAKAISMSKQKARAHESETEEEEEEEEDYTYHDFDDFDTTDATVHMDVVMTRLKQEFIEIVGTAYRPGLIRLGGDDFVLSVSLPVIELADSVPPRALMAWDRRLLSRSEHLILLISGFRSVYPALESDGTYTLAASRLSSSLSFKVGLCRRYKPGKEYVEEVARKHGLIIQDAEDEARLAAEKAAAQAQLFVEWPEDEEFDPAQMEVVPEGEEEEGEGEERFERFSLSSSLEGLMDHSFLKVLQLRRKFDLGWAGAEVLHSEVEKCQMKDDDVFSMQRKNILNADKEESKLGRTTILPHDPLSGLAKDTPINLPLAAFCYLIRRLSLVTRYCLVCHNKLQTDFEALKPYVCDSKLCSYQYYSLNHGPSLEYEIIHNPQTVDLLVSLAYDAATEHAMKEPLPIGMGLRVPHPGPAPNVQPQYRHHMAWNGQPVPVQEEPIHVPKGPAVPGDDGLVEFDDLDIGQMRLAISKLIDSLPPIDEMKKYLERRVKAGKSKPKLKEMDPKVLPAAWAILRWCVASCTAHIEEITSPDELVKGVDPVWRQFRLSVGAPDAEAKFKNSVAEAQKIDNNAKKYPVLYAFHGSPVKNWHSIVRHGLWFKDVANGRAYGNGVYLAKDSSISMGSYSTPAGATWRKSSISPSHLAALVEVVNLPSQFVSSNPYFVVQNTHWLMCRYLLVKGAVPLDPVEEKPKVVTKSSKKKKSKDETTVPLVQLDPAHPTQASHKPIGIPDPAHHVEVLLDARRQEYTHVEPDSEDLSIFEFEPTKKPLKQSQSQPVIEDDDEDYRVPAPSASKAKAKAPVKPKDDWKHNEQWVTSAVENLMPPPVDATPSATMAVQRELKSMLKEQDNANSFKELGWYMPPDLIGDNLFQWIIEMHSFDPDIPIAKDMKANKLNSIIFEVRFPPDFPIAPPFFRILTPRFLPFIQGGGGHITGGGSICMDLLTSSGWLPSYSVPAVIMQIKLAISNLEPRPARLARDWQRSYSIGEALEGYKRAAATHGWQLPKGIDHLVR
ncbi:hypothetical protein BDQ12DRAFT_165045 [Crucibulum laeve]|uniref:UBC core domain-containing protein n=1 Tax=Crucibulum laeve TaxID=68775 RepID=A0A5C3MEK1_9AGAR|nr:hypothetical protein BDQ12DRAFT_165045 [Crucibulum laeve]